MFYLVLYFFNLTEKNTCKNHGEGTVNIQACQKCFAMYRAEDLSLYDDPRSEKSVEIDNDQIKALTKTSSCHEGLRIRSLIQKSRTIQKQGCLGYGIWLLGTNSRGMRSTEYSSLPLLPCQLWLRVVVSIRVQYIGQMVLFKNSFRP